MAQTQIDTRYEYIQMPIDAGDLAQLNRLGGQGWRLVTVIQTEMRDVALLERAYRND